jgi:hypothetical protein
MPTQPDALTYPALCAAVFLLFVCLGLTVALLILQRRNNRLQAKNQELRWQANTTGRDARQSRAYLGVWGDWYLANHNQRIPAQRDRRTS